MNRLFALCLSFVAVALLTQPLPASACATCFGASDSPLAQGMNMGILSLLGVTVLVLGSVASFFIYLIRRSASQPTPPASDLLSESTEKA